MTDGILIISKQIKSVPEGERYELLLRWKVIRILMSYDIKKKEIVGRVLLVSQVISLLALTFFTDWTIFNFGEYYYGSFS